MLLSFWPGGGGGGGGGGQWTPGHTPVTPLTRVTQLTRLDQIGVISKTGATPLGDSIRESSHIKGYLKMPFAR
jgi:hypothetical protein